MALLGNIIWLVTSFFIPLGYLLFGIILFPLLPWLWPMIKFSFLPFGRELVKKTQLKKDIGKKDDPGDIANATQIVRILANIVWPLTAGWILALGHIAAGILNVFLIWLIFPIPNIMAHFRLVPVAFQPFGRIIISKELSQKVKSEKADRQLKELKK